MRSKILITLLVSLVMIACVDNEKSFYIEHTKATAEAPSCEISPGDATQSTYSINLQEVKSPEIAFFVTNAIMPREDVGILKAEANILFIQGYEVYTTIPGLGAIGGTEYFVVNKSIEPDSSDIILAGMISDQVIDTLSSEYGCNRLDSTQLIKDVSVYGSSGDLNISQLITSLNYSEEIPSSVYSVVKFFGVTQGGKKLETQEFSFKINLSCGPVDGWARCIKDPCLALCSPNAIFAETCYEGVGTAMRCEDYLSTLGGRISGNATEFDVDGNAINFVPDEDGDYKYDYCTQHCSQ